MATRLLHDGANAVRGIRAYSGNDVLLPSSPVGLTKRENPSGYKKTKRHGNGSRFSPKYTTGVISSVTPSQSNNLLLHVRGRLASFWHLMPGMLIINQPPFETLFGFEKTSAQGTQQGYSTRNFQYQDLCRSVQH